ncbi:MAG: DUF4386 domain-containing protein [Chloroflexota bacterium]|nr:MAG: DUF4386 domain-containing protein [Chloroflexota bacterium]
MTSSRQSGNTSQRRVALAGGLGLLLIALLSPFAFYGVIQTMIVPADAVATVTNLLASEGLYRAAIAALLVVVMLDVIVAWALYVLMRPVNEALAQLVAWLRVVYAGVFAIAIASLVNALHLVTGPVDAATQSSVQLAIQAAASIDSFTNVWDVGLAIFGLHLAGLGILLFKFAYAPRLLGVLVSLAGVGYLSDSFGKILVPDYALTISIVTFVGEALLMLWLLWRAFKGFPANLESITALDEKAGSPKVEPAPIAV